MFTDQKQHKVLFSVQPLIMLLSCAPTQRQCHVDWFSCASHSQDFAKKIVFGILDHPVLQSKKII
jgi:hypothetical protein